MIGTLFRNEIRMLLRDTRTVLIAVVAPLVLFPLFILVSNWVDQREAARLETETYRYAVEGERSEWARGIVARALALDATVGDTATVADSGGPSGPLGNADADDDGIQPADFELVATPRPDSLLQAEDLHLVVVARDALPEDSVAAGVPVLELRFRARSDFSRNARDRMEERLTEVRHQMRDSIFRTAGLPVTVDSVAPFRAENVASAAKEAGSFLGGVLVPFLVLLMLSGGSIVAADSISGEKERGTLETLLTTAASRSAVVQAKLGAIMAVGLAVTVINVANLGVYIGLGVLDLPESLQVGLSIPDLALLFLLMLPLVVLVGASLLLLSGVAKSYKEYQIYFLPLFLGFLVPSAAAFMPGMELQSAIVLVPVSGIAVATRSLLMGDWHLLWGMAAFASTGLAGWYLTTRTEAVLSNERLITSAGADEADFRGGAALYPRHVIRWFIGFWVFFFVTSLWFGEALGVRGQVAVNLVGIFFGGSILLIRRYDLDVKETLQLYRPHWRAWPAVLIGAPSLLLISLGLGQLVNTWLFPVPQRMIEAFGESLTEGIPMWQLIFFITIMPGFFEEIAFRGILFTGLRKHFSRPWMAVLGCGLIFGLFHVSLFRIVPTGFLGVVLALVVLRTGSIFPAMLWHFLNNFLALVPEQTGWLELDPTRGVPFWWYAVAIIGAGISWLLMKERPGQRPPEPAGRARPAQDRAPATG
jgi:sodium transport system permease protein